MLVKRTQVGDTRGGAEAPASREGWLVEGCMWGVSGSIQEPSHRRGPAGCSGGPAGCSEHPTHPVCGLKLGVPHRGSGDSLTSFSSPFAGIQIPSTMGDLVLERGLQRPQEAAQGWGPGLLCPPLPSALSPSPRLDKSPGWSAGPPAATESDGGRVEGEGLATNRCCKLWFKTIT